MSDDKDERRSGNKGEWSEVYVLFRLLGDGRLYAGGANQEKLAIYYPIVSIIRQEVKKALLRYNPNCDGNVKIISDTGETLLVLPMQRFAKQADDLLESIKQTENKSAFEVPAAKAFMEEIGCQSIKAKSQDKADINIVIHDMRTGMTPLLGFSIKSQLGSDATLLNATMATNITFRVLGRKWSEEQIETVNEIEGHKERITAIVKHGCHLKFDHYDSKTFKNNLRLIDCCLPTLMTYCVVAANSPAQKSKDVRDILRLVAKDNPLEYDGRATLPSFMNTK